MNPKHAVQRARIDAYLHFHHELRLGLATYFQCLLQNKESSGAEKRMRSALDLFESYWLGDNAFVQSPSLTIADLQALHEVYQVTPFVPALLDGYPRMSRWVERMRQVPYHDEVLKGWNKVTPLLQKKFAANAKAKM